MAEKRVVIREEQLLFDPIMRRIEKIKENTNSLRAPNQEGAMKVKTQVEDLMKSTGTLAIEVRGDLDHIKSLGIISGASARRNLYNATCKAFHDAMMVWNITYSSVKNKITEEKRRMLEILPHDFSEEQIERIIAAGKEDAVLAQAFVLDEGVSSRDSLSQMMMLEDIVADVDDRHLEILHLEKQVLELLELFRDFAVLVDVNGEKLDNISHNISMASHHVEKAEVKLQNAERSQHKNRKYMCYCFCFLFLVLAVIMSTLGATVFSSP